MPTAFTDLSAAAAATATVVPYERRNRLLALGQAASSLAGAHELPALATRLARAQAARAAIIMSSTGDDCARWEGDIPVEALAPAVPRLAGRH